MIPAGGGAAAQRQGVSFAGVPDTPTPAAKTSGQALADVLLYANPPLTYLVAACGILVLAAAYYALRGSHNLTLLTGAPRHPSRRQQASLPCASARFAAQNVCRARAPQYRHWSRCARQ